MVLGPKVLDGQDRRTLREAGVSIDRAGRRVTGIEPGEIDQGQHDHNKAVLAVGSAGMLVRRDVWDQLGGFDTRLRLFRDDLDFCWRVQAAGYRVQVVTDAVLYHRELAARRRRPTEGGGSRRLDRRNALYVLAVNLPLLAMLWIVGGAVVGSIIRAAYFAADQAARHGARARRRGRLAALAPGPALAGPPSARRRARGGLRRGPHLHPARAHVLPGRGADRGADIGRPAAGVRRAAPGGRRSRKRTTSSSIRSP